MVRLEQIRLREGDLLADAFLSGVAPRQFDHVRIVLDAERFGAALGGGDDGAAVARAEVDDRVLRRHFR
jgi:hypothetical protein